MSTTTTSWVLDFIDHVTKPVKDMMKSVNKMNSGLEDVGKTVRLTERDIKEHLYNAKDHYKDLQKSIKDVEKELKDLERQKKSDNWTEQMKASRAYVLAKEKLERYRKALQGAEDDIRDLTDQLDTFNQKAQKWTDLATGINQGVELIRKATDGLNFSVDVANLTADVQRFTDLTGDALDEFVARSRKIAKVYDEDAREIAQAANAMTKQNGGTFEDNLALIEEGYKKGANANRDFLDQLKEYQPFIKQLGLDQSQAIALIANAGKEGIFSDKALDSLKEANMALREMQKPQVDALKGIGLTPEDLVGKTAFEAVQLIAKQMKDATTQARQLVLADIFKGAGEDAGADFIQGLGNMDLDITKLPSVEQAGAGIKGFFSDISTWAGQAFGDVGIYAKELSPMLQFVAAAIPIMQTLTKVTWLQQAAQWALNIAMAANPIGLIIIAVAALIGLVVAIIKYYDEWGAAATYLLGPLGWIINLVQSFSRHWDSITEAFNNGGIEAGLKRIGAVLFDALLKPMEQLLGLIAKIPGLGKLAEWQKGIVSNLRKQLNVQDPEPVPGEDVPSVNSLIKGKTVDVLGKTNTDDGKTGKGKDGLNVGSGANGIKSVVMTLNITNNFSVDKGSNIRDIADKVTGMINDRLRDAVINMG
jgi:phage-related minor tail protein